MTTMHAAPLKAARQLPISPSLALVGPDTRLRLGETVAELGRSVLVVSGPATWAKVGDLLEAPMAAAGLRIVVYTYDPDCTTSCVASATSLARTEGLDVIVGAGGGKALDLAKLVAHDLDRPCVTVPTSAATCAAWTALGNLYEESGAFKGGRALPRAPQAVIVDTVLIAAAPARLLASGLADSLAKWIETSASVDYLAADMTTRAAWQMARFLFDEIRDWGVQAYQDARAGLLTPTVERAIEANVVLAGTVGGLGGERCRSVAAHAVCNALTSLPEVRASWHGEKVAFGILTQLLLQGREAEAAELASFFHAIDVPVTLAGLGHPLSEAGLLEVAKRVCAPTSTVHYLPFPVTPLLVREALHRADALGQSASQP